MNLIGNAIRVIITILRIARLGKDKSRVLTLFYTKQLIQVIRVNPCYKRVTSSRVFC